MLEFFLTLFVIIVFGTILLLFLTWFLSALFESMPALANLAACVVKIILWLLKISLYITFWPFVLIWWIAKKCSPQQPQ